MPATNIEWAHDSENVAAGCTEARLSSGKMDPACVHCYARLASARNEAIASAAGRVSIYTGVADRDGNTARWTGRLTWDRDLMRRRFQAMRGEHRVFLGSMTDLWHADHDPALLVALAEEIRRLGERTPEKRPNLITLTKRADRLLAWQREHFPDGLPAWVWPGVTAGCQDAVNERIPLLLQVRAEGPRVVSVEPMTGPVKLRPYFLSFDVANPGACANCGQGHGFTRCPNYGQISPTIIPGPGWPAGTRPCHQFRPAYQQPIGWVIAGGESGQKARPSHPGWFRALRDQCVAAGVPFHFKQHGEFAEVDPSEAQRGDLWLCPGRSLAGADGPLHTQLWHPGDEGAKAGRWSPLPDVLVRRVGKHVAGRLLDGRTWDEVPDAR